MKTIKMLTILPLMIYLSSCQAPQISPVKMYRYSSQFQACRIWCWDINTRSTIPDDKCGKEFKSGNYPIEACDGVAGFSEDDWAISILPWSNDLERWGDDRCK